MKIPHTKKLMGAGALGMALPFLLGADGGPIATDGQNPLVIIGIQMLVAAIAAPVTVACGVALKAVGDALVAWGTSKLKDKDPSNDSVAAAVVAAGKRLNADNTEPAK